jgi:hypothetical protein
MVQIDDKFRKAYYDYSELHRRLEMIDSAVITNFNNKYAYYDNEFELISSSHPTISAREFSADLVYLGRDKRGVLFIEETTDPSNKADQLFKYAHVSSASLKAINKADNLPCVDTFLVFPEKERENGLLTYDELANRDCSLGKQRGVSLWCYPDNMKSLKCVGGCFSEYLPDCPPELKFRLIHTLKITKKASTIHLLQFIVMKALEAEYGLSKENIEFNRAKLFAWMEHYGLVNEQRWRDALRMGELVGWISNYSPEQLTGVINYSKKSPQSIINSKVLMADFFEAIKEDIDEKQKRLSDFY